MATNTTLAIKTIFASLVAIGIAGHAFGEQACDRPAGGRHRGRPRRIGERSRADLEPRGGRVQ